MSYAGPTRPNRSPQTDGSDEEEPRPRAAAALRAANWPSRAPNGRSRNAAVFAAGLVVGLAIGAGAALLLAPESGAQTRRALIRRGRRVTLRGRDAWDDLRDELRSALRDRLRERRRRRAAREAAAV
jgi:hypothetical protein